MTSPTASFRTIRPEPGASFLTAVKRYWMLGGQSRGRASRSEFWWAYLHLNIIIITLAILEALIGHFSTAAGQAIDGYLLLPFAFITIAPSLAIAVRRLHDTNRSGWFWLLSLIPLVGGIVLLVFYCQRGTAGANRYDEKAAARGSLLSRRTSLTLSGILSLIAGEAIVAVVVMLGALDAWGNALLIADGGTEGGVTYTSGSVPGLFSMTTTTLFHATPEVALDINAVGWHIAATLIGAALFALTIAQRRWAHRNGPR